MLGYIKNKMTSFNKGLCIVSNMQKIPTFEEGLLSLSSLLLLIKIFEEHVAWFTYFMTEEIEAKSLNILFIIT